MSRINAGAPRTAGLGASGRDGVMVGGAAERAPEFQSAQVGGLDLAFEKGAELDGRRVVLNGQNGDTRTLELEPGKNRRLSFEGHDVLAQGESLFVDGQRVDFRPPEDARSGFDSAHYGDAIDQAHAKLDASLGRLQGDIDGALGRFRSDLTEVAAGNPVGTLDRSIAHLSSQFPEESDAIGKLQTLRQQAAQTAASLGPNASPEASARASAELGQLAGEARGALAGVQAKLPGWAEEARGVSPSAFQSYVQSALANQGGVGPQAMYQMNYGDMMSAYNPSMLHYGGLPQQSFGGYEMPPGVFGPNVATQQMHWNPGAQQSYAAVPPGYGYQPQQAWGAPPYGSGPIVPPQQQDNGWLGGMGRPAMAAAGGAALLGLGAMAFSYPMFGLGMGWPGSGLGLGGFNWWAF